MNFNYLIIQPDLDRNSLFLPSFFISHPINIREILYKQLTLLFLIILTSCGLQLQVQPPSEFIFINEIALTFIPQDITFNNSSHTLYLLKDHNTVYQINLQGRMVQKIGGFGLESGKFTKVTDMTTDTIGKLYIVDEIAGTITLYDENVEFIKDYKFLEVSEPYLIAVKDDGAMLIANGMDNEVYCFDSSGQSENKLRYQIGRFELLQPKVLSASSNFTYILDGKENAVFIFDNFGGYIDKISADKTLSSRLNDSIKQLPKTLQPRGKIVSITSNRDFLYLLDSNKNIFICHPQYEMRNISSLLKISGQCDRIYSSNDFLFLLCGEKLKVWEIRS